MNIKDSVLITQCPHFPLCVPCGNAFTRVLGQKGSATLLAIFLSAIIITLGVGFNWLVRERLRATEALKVKTEAMLEARSAFDTLIYLMLSGQRDRKEVHLLKLKELDWPVKIPLNGAETEIREGLRISLQDSNGLLSLRSLNEPALKRLIENLSGQDATGIIESYLDWIDRDRLARVNGAEEFYYKAKGLPYVPGNLPVQYKEEIGLIKGMNKELYNKLAPYVTYLPAPAFNPNTAPAEVLKAFLNIDEKAANRLLEHISVKPVSDNAALLALTGRTLDLSDIGSPNFSSTFFMDITIKAGPKEKADSSGKADALRPVYTIRAGLDLRSEMRYPYTVMSWVEE